MIQDGGTLLSDLATTAAVSTAYLAKAGGTMSGAINMNSQQITNAGAITTANQKVLIGASATSADTLSVTIGDTASTIGANTIAIGNSASATAGAAVVVGSLSVASGVASLASGYFCQASGYQSTALGFGNIASGYSSLLVGTGNRGTANYASVVGHNQINGTANSLIIGDASYANIRTASGICDLGTVAQPFQTIYLNGSIAGTTNTRTVDNIVSNTGASVSGNIASLSGTTGKVITDSGVVAASVVVGPASVVTGRIASYNGTTGKLVADSGVLATDIVIGPASSVNNQVTLFNGTTGKAVMTGAAAIGTLGALTLANTTDSSSVSTGTIICPGGLGVAKKAYIGDSIFVNTTSATAKIVVSGGVQNLAGEDSCIRAISSSNATKIEIANTAASGRLWEMRSTNAGNFDS